MKRFFFRRNRDLEHRVSEFTAAGRAEQAAARHADVHAELGPERSFRNLGFVRRLLADAELAGLEVQSVNLLALIGMASLAVSLAGVLVLGSAWGILFGLIVPVVARWYVTSRLTKVRRAFAEQLPENLDVLSSALRSGHSLIGGLTVTVEAAPDPSRPELGRALADEQLGVPLDDALRVVAQRMDNRDLVQVALVARLQREAGTNAAEVLDQVSANIRGQMELRRLIRTLTAQGRMARWIVSLLPVVLFVLLFFLNREYLRPLWEEALGKAALVLAAIMVAIGSLVIKKIVEFEV